MPEDRRKELRKLLRRTLADPGQQHRIRSRLEEELPSDDALPLVLEGPGATPLTLELRRYWDMDGYRHNGIFDPQGSPSDLPVMRSERVFGRP